MILFRDHAEDCRIQSARAVSAPGTDAHAHLGATRRATQVLQRVRTREEDGDFRVERRPDKFRFAAHRHEFHDLLVTEDAVAWGRFASFDVMPTTLFLSPTTDTSAGWAGAKIGVRESKGDSVNEFGSETMFVSARGRRASSN